MAREARDFAEMRRLQRGLPHQLDDSLENYALLRHIAALASV